MRCGRGRTLARGTVAEQAPKSGELPALRSALAGSALRWLLRGGLAGELLDQLLRSNGAVAFVDPLAQQLEWRRLTIVEGRRDPTVLAQAGSFTPKPRLLASARMNRKTFLPTLIARSPQGKSSWVPGYASASSRRVASAFKVGARIAAQDTSFCPRWLLAGLRPGC
jgi:hypothetical protein